MIEPSRAGSLLLVALIAAEVSAAAVVAQRRSGAGALTITTVVSAATLLALGLLEWRHPSSEAPLITYILAAVIPATVAAVLIYRVRRYPVALQWAVGLASFLVVLFPALVLGTYVLSDFVRF